MHFIIRDRYGIALAELEVTLSERQWDRLAPVERERLLDWLCRIARVFNPYRGVYLTNAGDGELWECPKRGRNPT